MLHMDVCISKISQCVVISYFKAARVGLNAFSSLIILSTIFVLNYLLRVAFDFIQRFQNAIDYQFKMRAAKKDFLTPLEPPEALAFFDLGRSNASIMNYCMSKPPYFTKDRYLYLRWLYSQF